MRRRGVGIGHVAGTAQRLRSGLAAAGGLALLVLLVVGVPVALLALVGWPLPHGVPEPSDISRALDDPSFIPDRFWIGLAALVAWVAWLEVTGAIVVELVAAVAHRPSPNVVLFVAPARHLARRLVSSATLVGMLVTSRPALAGGALRPPAVMATVGPAGAGAAPLVGAPVGGGAALSSLSSDRTAFVGLRVAEATAGSRPVYVVQSWEATRDCLWSIAERYLGDALRWREIWELNRGRPQPDGDALTEPDLIRPGWELLLPNDAVDLVAPPEISGAPPVVTGAPPVVTSPASEAAPEPGGGSSSASSTTAPSGLVPTSVAPTSTVATSGTASSGTATSVAGTARTSATVATRPTRAVDDGALGRAGARALRYGLVGLPVMAAGGVVVALNRRRRAQVAACRPGRDIRRPAPELEPLERRLRAIAAEDAGAWVDAALRALAAALTASGRRRLPDIVAVRPGDLGIEVLLLSPDDDAPSGWEPTDDGFVWRLDDAVELAELQRRGAEHASISPALVSLGGSPEGAVLVDLEALGALSVEGDPARVAAFLAGVALELACAPWAQGVDLRLVGDGGPLAEDDGVVCVDDAEGLVAELTGLMDATREALADHPSVLAARLDAHSGDDWAPTVVVVRPGAATPEVLEDVASVARAGGAGLALVAPGPLMNARWRLVIGADATATLEPLGLSMQVAGMAEGLQVSQAGLEEAVINEAADLLAVAADDADVPPRVAVEWAEEDGFPASASSSASASPSAESPPGAEVWVAVLGPVEVTGWATPIRQRKKFAELVTYLATHDDRPVPGERLHAACWPDLEGASYASFKETLSRARNHLGDDSEGRRHLPPAVSSAYRLGPHVGCDWTRFRTLVREAGRAGGGSDAVAMYREALELVRGEPFAGVAKGTYVWAWSEGLVYEMELAVAKAAAAMGQLALGLGDPESARWASAQGLKASPAQQSLFRVEMQAAADIGDTDGITRAMEAATRAQQNVDPETDPPLETVELYRHLIGRHCRARAEVTATR